jgi:hypothetical protein
MTTIPITDFDPRKPFLDKTGQMVRDAFTRLNDLIKRTGGERGEAFGPLPDYTVATLPSAANNARCLIYVSDGSSNRRFAVSDGAAWRFGDGNVVS